MKKIGLKKQKLSKVLKIIAKKLGKKVKWVLVGSTSLALQGVKIKPKDIDILTDKKGAIEINKIFKKYEIEPVKFKVSRFFKSYFGKFKIKGMKVEVMGNLEEKIKNKWISLSKRLKARKFVKMGKFKIPVSPLKEQLKSYRRLGRKKDLKRVKKIEEAILK